MDAVLRPYCCVLAEFDGDTRHAERCRYAAPSSEAATPAGSCLRGFVR